jgi:hypothetical protein
MRGRPWAVRKPANNINKARKADFMSSLDFWAKVSCPQLESSLFGSSLFHEFIQKPIGLCLQLGLEKFRSTKQQALEAQGLPSPNGAG